MATEIATAYVSLVPSFKGGAKAIASEFDGPAADAGKDSGKTFGGSFSEAFKGLVAAGAIFGGAQILAGAFKDAIAQADLPGIMRNQFGFTEQVAAESAQTASDVYAAGWGASLGEVGEAVGEVTRQLDQLGQTGDVTDLTTSAEALAATFDEDVNGVISSASQLVKTGLAPDMQSAFDVMAAGFQAGVDSGDDFLDTITEYSVKFQGLGLDGETAFGLINQGLEAGARNSDLVADALKELDLRVASGDAAAGFEAIGLSAEQMHAAFAEGGPAAAAALDQTMDALRGIEDPAARDAAAVALFGTKFEDMGDSLYALDPSSAAEGLGEVAGAAADVAESAGGGTQAQIDALGRAFDQGLMDAVAPLIPVLQDAVEFLAPFAPIIGPIVAVLAALSVILGIVAIATMVFNAALWANPIVWIIAAVIALIAIIVLLVTHWDTVSAALVDAWNWIKDMAVTIWTAISDFFVNLWNTISNFFVSIWTSIKNFFVGVWNSITTTVVGIWNSIKNFFVSIWNAIVNHARGQVNALLAVIGWISSLPGKVSGWFQGVYNSAKDKLNSLVDWVKGIPDRILSALGNLGSLLKDAGRDILQGLLDGIESMWNSVKNKLNDLTGMIPDWKGPADRDRTLLVEAGKLVIGGFARGLESEFPTVEAKLAKFTGSLSAAAAPPGTLQGMGTAMLSDEDRELLRELAASRSRVDVRLGANLTAAQRRENAMAVA